MPPPFVLLIFMYVFALPFKFIFSIFLFLRENPPVHLLAAKEQGHHAAPSALARHLLICQWHLSPLHAPSAVFGAIEKFHLKKEEHPHLNSEIETEITHTHTHTHTQNIHTQTQTQTSDGHLKVWCGVVV